MEIIQKQRGFTLIELILVIVILSTLAAFALSRFSSLNHEASEAVFNAHAGAFKAAVNQYFLVWQTNGKIPTAFAPYDIVPALAGYPAGGSNLATAFGSDCILIWQNLLQEPISLPFVSAVNGWSASLNNAQWAYNAERNSSLGESIDVFCHFVYGAAAVGGGYTGLPSDRVPMIQYNIQTGAVIEMNWPYSP